MKMLSIKQVYIWTLVGIVSAAILLSSIINIRLQSASHERALVKSIQVLSGLTARSIGAYLVEDNSGTSQNKASLEAVQSKLNDLSVAEFVEHVHIFRLNSAQQPIYFAGYNRAGLAAISPQIERLKDLADPSFADEYIELFTPISAPTKTNDVSIGLESNTIGYLYMRGSTARAKQTINRALIGSAIVAIVSIVIAFFIANYLQGVITRPLAQLTAVSQKAYRQKDFSSRAVLSQVEELDALIMAYNNLLEQIEEILTEQHKAAQENQRLTASLEEKVSQRTTALKEANQELIETLEKLHQFQRQLVQNEKMASLGDMVAGVAHEVNTPIGLGVTASTMMLDRLTNLRKDFESKSLKASSLGKFIDESNENLNIIYRNLNRAAELISSFKQVAVDQSTETTRVFSVHQLMDEILLSLRPKLKKHAHEIHVHCDETLYVESKAGPINQIMINLIMNSLIHGFEHIQKGEINISAELSSRNRLKLIYTDNGKGIPETMRKRIFDPFVTTKRGQGGSGLGMHLVYNLVTQALNGSISLSSEEGAGVEFQIMFPVVIVDDLSKAQ